MVYSGSKNLMKLRNLRKLNSVSTFWPFASRICVRSGHLFAAGWYLPVGPWPTKGSASQVLAKGNNETVKPYFILTANVSWLFDTLTLNHYDSTSTICHHMSPYVVIVIICSHMLPWFSRFATMTFQVNMQAREYCGSVGIKNKPIILSHHMMLLVSKVKRYVLCLYCLCSTMFHIRDHAHVHNECMNIIEYMDIWILDFTESQDGLEGWTSQNVEEWSWLCCFHGGVNVNQTFRIGNLCKHFQFGLRSPCPQHPQRPQDTPEDVRRKITNAACPRVLAEDPLAHVQ